MTNNDIQAGPDMPRSHALKVENLASKIVPLVSSMWAICTEFGCDVLVMGSETIRITVETREEADKRDRLTEEYLEQHPELRGDDPQDSGTSPENN